MRLAQRVHSPFLCVPFCRGVEQAACLHRCRQMGGPAAAELPPLDSTVAARYSVGSVLGKGAYGKGGERAAPCAPALATEDISSFFNSLNAGGLLGPCSCLELACLPLLWAQLHVRTERIGRRNESGGGTFSH